MKTKYLAAVSALLLAGCVYSETPYGPLVPPRLPSESRHHHQQTVTINAPARDDRHLSRQRTRPQLPGLIPFPAGFIVIDKQR